MFKSPSAGQMAPPQAPPPPPNPPMFGGAGAGNAAKARKPQSGGFAGTILGGITQPAQTSQKTLLGQ